MADIIKCGECKENCCNFPKVNGLLTLESSVDLADKSNLIASDGTCANLAPNMMCTGYNTRPLECRLYPFMMNNDLNMYMATSCPSHARIIKGLQERDPDTIKYLVGKFNILLNTPAYVKEDFTRRIEGYQTTVRINLADVAPAEDFHW